jgi:hypothetical protein
MEQAKNKEDTESLKMKSPARVIFINYFIMDIQEELFLPG